MAIYQLIATTTVADASVSIISGLGAGQAVEVVPRSAGVYVNVTGGTASAAGAGCLYIPKDGFAVISIEGVTTTLTAIREASTSAQVTVAVIS